MAGREEIVQQALGLPPEDRASWPQFWSTV